LMSHKSMPYLLFSSFLAFQINDSVQNYSEIRLSFISL
jgi:hypothetical protein